MRVVWFNKGCYVCYGENSFVNDNNIVGLVRICFCWIY